ncbi:MAG: ParA family protein [Bacteroidales bacterium]|nr:ParA family protein [Bacteroidales bacterium]
MKKCTVIAITNFKGGVGKTTTAVNLSHGLADRGFKTLVVDMDAQADLTKMMGFDGEVTGEHCISNALRNQDKTAQPLLVKKNLDILPSFNITMIGMETELQNMLMNGDRQLKRILDPIKNNYNFIIIDLPPALNALVVNAYAIAEKVIAPVASDFLSLSGYYTLEERLSGGLNVTITDILVTRHEKGTVISRQTLEAIQAERGKKVFKAVIPKNVALKEQGSVCQSIFDYEPSSTGAKAYTEFVEELIERI